jgi:hypothetical protein
LVAFHDDPDPVTSQPCWLPDESTYSPTATHSDTDGQATEIRPG